jgi:hypothetical protein
MTASSVVWRSLIERVSRALQARQVGRQWEMCWRTTSRLPIRREANSAVPPRSLAEHRRITVVSQFSQKRLGVAEVSAQLRDGAGQLEVMLRQSLARGQARGSRATAYPEEG